MKLRPVLCWECKTKIGLSPHYLNNMVLYCRPCGLERGEEE